MILALQIAIGLALGFMMRIAFAAVELAGELCGLTMGLSFASQFDPLSEHPATVTSQLFSWLALLVFISSNLHLAMLAALADSFQQIPISDLSPGSGFIRQLAMAGAKVFSGGLQLAMPVIATLLMTNLALSILTRAAPQLNVFSIGMPITLTVGFAVIILLMPYLANPLVSTLGSAITSTLSR
jgi:flagellar biosynthetic protein FliR